MGYAVRGWRLYSFAIATTACYDDGRHRRGLPNLRLNRVHEEDKDHVHASTAYTVDDVVVKVAGKTYKQVHSLTHLGIAITKTTDTSAEIVRRTRACWIRIRWYVRELYGQSNVTISLKTRIVKVETIEALLYGCIS